MSRFLTAALLLFAVWLVIASGVTTALTNEGDSSDRSANINRLSPHRIQRAYSRSYRQHHARVHHGGHLQSIHHDYSAKSHKQGHHRPTLTAHQRAALMQRVSDNLEAIGDDAKKIIDYVLNGAGKHQTWNRLAQFTDTVGNRVSGSEFNKMAVDYMLKALTADGLQNVNGEEVTVPHWDRGQESAWLLEPRLIQLNILGLGGSVGANNITAPVLVVNTFDELHNQSARGNTSGKIIVFNEYCDWNAQPIDCYGVAVAYRSQGAAEAAKAGGVAALVRTVGAFSINSPHTGMMDYDDGIPQVPTASITIEDAEMLRRMQDRGQHIVINLNMEAQNLPDAQSNNVVAEIVGSEYPDQVVLVSGHIDSWDVGHGAMDDGGGAFISWSTLSILNALGLKPKRTIRFVGWACEEFGGIGAQQYYDRHSVNVSNYDLVMESDLGVFKAQGIQFTGNDAAMKVMQQVGQLLAPINATLVTDGGDGTDIDPWMEAGVPGASLANENDRYFWFHHSHGDTMSVLDPDDVDLCAITWAVTAYAVASLDDMLPH